MLEEAGKVVISPEHREGIPRGEAPNVAREKINIPDYVMQDFGFSKSEHESALTSARSYTRRMRLLREA